MLAKGLTPKAEQAFQPGEQQISQDREQRDQHRALHDKRQLVGGEPFEDRRAEGQAACATEDAIG